jgi:hypothetical protein
VPVLDQPLPRFVAALLAAGDATGEGAAVAEWEPPRVVVILPAANALVAVLDRAALQAAALERWRGARVAPRPPGLL